MACCGEKRQQVRGQTTSLPAQEPVAPGERRPPLSAPPLPRVTPVLVSFTYVGSTGLTTVGPATGRRYRFDGPGAVVAVDRRDAPSLAAVPNLQRTSFSPA